MHNKLGLYIRSHRERLQPQEVGLPSAGRRRTAGLRREELAQLCGVSPTWLTWLEQGRPVSASAKLLAVLADVLRLTPAERHYLFSLAEKHDPHADAQQSEASTDLAAMVNAIRTPAYVLDREWNALAWNRAARLLFAGWLDQRDGASPPNLLHFMFLSPAAPQLIRDWPDRAARLVAEFRADCGKHADQPPLAGLIAGLAERSSSFRQLWAAQHVVDRAGGRRHFLHPRDGELVYDQVTLHLARQHDLKLVMLLPVSAADRPSPPPTPASP